MEINKIKIYNFKSIDEIEFEIKKHGNSYTTMFLGKNESGKSNILEAMSFLNLDTSEEFDYSETHNQKDEENYTVLIEFYLAFESQITYLKTIKDKIINGDLLTFKIESITKSLYLEEGFKNFYAEIDYKVINLSKNLFIKKTSKSEIINGQTKTVEFYELSKIQDEGLTFELLTEDLFIKYFGKQLKSIIENHIPNCSFWQPSEKYLISDVDLNSFKDNINSNIPLKHIFALSGYKDKESIKKEIEKISNPQQRRKLMSSLSKNVTKYIKEIWNHGIEIDIEITDSGKCIVNVKDEGKKNEHNFYRMGVRSEGFKQFMSLILSLSIEAKKLGIQNKLILIDEPENHLHPSGVRDLREELLKIGEKNYLFVSTHSPFLIDTKNKERNIIIKKNNSAITEKREINSFEDIRDDEVLDEAFGINIYKDLLIPHRILVEGASDKIILDKIFKLSSYNYGVTNCAGSNIISVATKFNQDQIDILVIIDDDEDGKNYKKEIISIGGVYNENNVFTIRDLVGEMKNNGTIEDLLGKDFVESKFTTFYKNKIGKDFIEKLDENKPFIQQIKIILQKEKKYSKEIINDFKKDISDYFNPTKSSYETKFPLLKILLEKIKEKL